MRIKRRFTTEGQDPYATVSFRTATSEIRNPDGSVVFQAEGIEVPAEGSQVASDILAPKYFGKALRGQSGGSIGVIVSVLVGNDVDYLMDFCIGDGHGDILWSGREFFDGMME